MNSRRNKLFMLTVVVWFALLLAISPILHKNLDDSIQAQGLHLKFSWQSKNNTVNLHIGVVDKLEVKVLNSLLSVIEIYATLTE